MSSHARRPCLRSVVAVLLLGLASACSTAGPKPSRQVAGDDTPSLPSLAKLAEAKNRNFGTAVTIAALRKDPDYASLLSSQFDVIILENELKFRRTHPARDRYDFTDSDYGILFARDHGMRVRGHTLVWHESVPDWLKEGTFTPDALKGILREHVTTVVSHCRQLAPGTVYAWDVVNEALEDEHPTEIRAEGPFKRIGNGKDDFIRLAFQWAHEADPDAKLFYSDYGIESESPRSDAALAMIREMKADGIPIDGIAFHMHQRADRPRSLDSIRRTFQRFADLGLEIHISELDDRILLRDGKASAEDLATQADLYEAVLRICLEQKACSLFASWGFTDRYSWVPDDEPGWGSALYFDRDLEPKPAFHAMVRALMKPPTGHR